MMAVCYCAVGARFNGYGNGGGGNDVCIVYMFLILNAWRLTPITFAHILCAFYRYSHCVYHNKCSTFAVEKSKTESNRWKCNAIEKKNNIDWTNDESLLHNKWKWLSFRLNKFGPFLFFIEKSVDKFGNSEIFRNILKYSEIFRKQFSKCHSHPNVINFWTKQEIF